MVAEQDINHTWANEKANGGDHLFLLVDYATREPLDSNNSSTQNESLLTTKMMSASYMDRQPTTMHKQVDGNCGDIILFFVVVGV